MYKILVVDDEEKIRSLIRKYAEFEGHSVTEATNGMEAVTICRKQNFDIIILDIMMPKVDGITVLKTIRKQGNTVPVLMLTAKSEVDDKVEGLDSGANDYLTKPFQSKELLARIRAMIRNGTSQTTSRLKMGNVTLDQSTFELSTPSGSVRLANKEFQMLELMMTNPHRLISSENFMETLRRQGFID